MRPVRSADAPPRPLLCPPTPTLTPPQAYKPLQIFVALVGMEVWSSGDQISVTPPAGATLDAFMRWRNDQLVKWKKHDNAHLIRWERVEPDPLGRGGCRSNGAVAMVNCTVPTFTGLVVRVPTAVSSCVLLHNVA